MKCIGTGGHFIFPEDPAHPAAVYLRDFCGIEAEPGDVIQHRVSIVTNERKQREVRRFFTRIEGGK